MIPDWVTRFDPYDHDALKRRARDLDKARSNAKIERRVLRRERAGQGKTLAGVTTTCVGVVALGGSMLTGDPFTIWAALSALSTVSGIPLTGDGLRQRRRQRLRLQDLDAQIRVMTREMQLVEDALRHLHARR